MDQIVLNDGTTWNGNIIQTGNQLFFYVYGQTLKQVFDKLIVASKAKKVTYTSGGQSQIFKGYSKLIAVRDEGNNLITAVTEKVV